MSHPPCDEEAYSSTTADHLGKISVYRKRTLSESSPDDLYSESDDFVPSEQESSSEDEQVKSSEKRKKSTCSDSQAKSGRTEKTLKANNSRLDMGPIESDQIESDEEDSSEDESIQENYRENDSANQRNSGMYGNATGGVTDERKRVPPHSCKIRNCDEVITDEVGDEIFKEYWGLQSHKKRVFYVMDRVELCSIKQRRPRHKTASKHPKGVAYKYFFYVNGKKVQVCKSTFLNTLGETDRFLRCCMQNRRKAYLNTTQSDREEKQDRAYKLEKTREVVKDNISPSQSREEKQDRVHKLEKTREVVKDNISPSQSREQKQDRAHILEVVKDNISPSQSREEKQDRAHKLEKTREVVKKSIFPSQSRESYSPRPSGNRTRKEKEDAKRRRNAGMSYVNSSGRITEERKRKPPHICKIRKCEEVITDEVGNAIFSEYWGQQSHGKRVLYVMNKVEICSIKQRRPRLEAPTKHPKAVAYKYFFDVDGKKVQVCKSTFLNTLGETDQFLRCCMQKRRDTYSEIIYSDRRGRRDPPHKLNEQTREAVEDHIYSFSSCESHDCGDEMSYRYLPSTLNITKMHAEYLNNNKGPKVSYSTYQRLFNECGRKFKPKESETWEM